MTKNRPEINFQAGQIIASVWTNEYKFGEEIRKIKSVSVVKRYKDKTGIWKNALGFRVDELPRVQLVLGKSYEYLMTSEIPIREVQKTRDSKKPISQISTPVIEYGDFSSEFYIEDCQ